jgi:hypothetical protein
MVPTRHDVVDGQGGSYVGTGFWYVTHDYTEINTNSKLKVTNYLNRTAIIMTTMGLSLASCLVNTFAYPFSNIKA